MNKINIAIIVVCVALAGWVFTLQQKVSTQAKYWEVMIENSPKEVQDFFFGEVDKK